MADNLGVRAHTHTHARALTLYRPHHTHSLLNTLRKHVNLQVPNLKKRLSMKVWLLIWVKTCRSIIFPVSLSLLSRAETNCSYVNTGYLPTSLLLQYLWSLEQKKVSKMIKSLLAVCLIGSKSRRKTPRLSALCLTDNKKRSLCHKLFLIMAIACFKVEK